MAVINCVNITMTSIHCATTLHLKPFGRHTHLINMFTWFANTSIAEVDILGHIGWCANGEVFSSGCRALLMTLMMCSWLLAVEALPAEWL